MTEFDDARLDDLYAAPLDEFTSARNALAKEVAGTGDKERAVEIKALAKPNAVAWALNQLVRSNAQEVDELLETAASLRSIQQGETGDLRATNTKVREQVAKLLARTQAIMEAEGKQATQTVKNRMLQSLMAAAAAEQAGAALRAGRLSRELEPGGFESGAAVFVSTQPDPRASQRRQEAKERARSLAEEAEAAEDEAKRKADEASRSERAAERARAAAEEAAATAEAKRARAIAAETALD